MQSKILSLETPANLDHSNQADSSTKNDNKKMIRVQNASGGYSMMPHVIKRLALKELKGETYRVFEYIWERTVAWRNLTETIYMSEFLHDLSSSKRTINTACNWLWDNGWISIEIYSRTKPREYGIPGELLRSAGCIMDEDNDGEESTRAKSAESTRAKSAPSLRVSKRRNKKIPIPSSSPDTIVYGKKKLVSEIRDGNGEIIRITSEDIDDLVAMIDDTPERVRQVADKFDRFHVSGPKIQYFMRRFPLQKIWGVMKDAEWTSEHKFKPEDFAGYLVSKLHNELEVQS